MKGKEAVQNLLSAIDSRISTINREQFRNLQCETNNDYALYELGTLNAFEGVRFAIEVIIDAIEE